jgi:exonuclease VII large subunit
MNADQSRDEPASPSSSIQHVSREQLEQREQALAALMRRREARTAAAAAKSSSGEMGDSSARLRETLRHEFQRSSDYAKKYHQLQEQVKNVLPSSKETNVHPTAVENLEGCCDAGAARGRQWP